LIKYILLSLLLINGCSYNFKTYNEEKNQIKIEPLPALIEEDDSRLDEIKLEMEERLKELRNE
tara:strand:- start:122 stop:310 length:189 start_codon:yes stop_codon:yes gene_type:complete